MGRAWKPGDVARVGGGRPITFYEREGGGEIMFTNTFGHVHPVGHLAKEARPLVVIDPEDIEQAVRLAGILLDRGVINDNDSRSLASVVAEALCSLANPKPDEPLGLGAVVEDAEGDRWVRVETAIAGDPRWFFNAREDDAACCNYDEINAVKVLSEGVTP